MPYITRVRTSQLSMAAARSSGWFVRWQVSLHHLERVFNSEYWSSELGYHELTIEPFVFWSPHAVYETWDPFAGDTQPDSTVNSRMRSGVPSLGH